MGFLSIREEVSLVVSQNLFYRELFMSIVLRRLGKPNSLRNVSYVLASRQSKPIKDDTHRRAAKRRRILCLFHNYVSSCMFRANLIQ